MSHQIVECPGCLTKLRVRESSERIILTCPRCNEELAVDPPEHLLDDGPKPSRSGSSPSNQQKPVPKPTPPVSKPAQKPVASGSSGTKTTSNTSSGGRTSSPSRSAQNPSWMKSKSGNGRPAPARDERDDEEWDSPPLRSRKDRARPSAVGQSKKGLWIALGVSGVVGVAAILFFVFRGGNEETSIASNGEAGTSSTTSDTNSSVGQNSGVTAQSTPNTSGLAGTATPSINTNPNPVVPGSGNGGLAGTPNPTFPPQPVNPPIPANPGGSSAPVAVPSGGLAYLWKPGTELSYNFTIEHGSGDVTRKTTGVCNYTVVGDVPVNVDHSEGSGTGFVVGSNGIIATCDHVVDGAKNIEVSLGGRIYPATVIATDKSSDVALIQIQGSGLTALPLVDSDKIQLAEQVRAIGYPLSDVLGTDVKITTGTVAGFVPLPGNAGRQIQIDAAINPGNSGGPVVNGAGQVIGIASAKLSGMSVTSVGFVAPVNELRRLAAANNIQLQTANRGSDLAGPDVARQVTPSVAFIKVSGVTPGRTTKLSFFATFNEHETMQNRGGFPFPSPPSFPSTSTDQGTLTVNAKGEILEFDGKEQLPAVLGPVGRFFIEPLDSSARGQWTVESQTTLQRIREEESSPFGPRFGPRFGGPRMRGFGPPGLFGQPEEQVVEEIPAVEQSSYQIEQSLNNKISIKKTYEFTATRSNGQPYMKIQGNGTLVFDTNYGMPASLEYSATVEQSDEGTTIRLPVKVNYTLRNPEDVKREREALVKQMEENKKKQEIDRTQPNPNRVEELIAEVRKAEGGFGASQPLDQLSNLAIVEDKRAEVLKIARNHMQNSNGFVKKEATEVFCRWSTEKERDELLSILETKDGLLFEAKKMALASLAKILKADDVPILINAMADFSVRADTKDALIAMGSPVEKPIIKEFPQQTDPGLKNDLLEVLKKVGTKDSIAFLQGLADSNDFSVKTYAQQALDAVRSRL